MNWIVPAGGAALGFLFSLLGGLLGGVGFLDLLLRGLLWAVLMGALSFGLQVLLGQFLPELFAESPLGTNSGNEVSEDDLGPAKVDITLGDDVPEGETGYYEDVSDDGPSSFASSTPRSSGLPVLGDDLESMGDDFPDMGNLAPMGVETLSGNDSEPDYTSGKADTVEYEGQQEDPAILARAVQTVMKREGDK
ncbi:MAG: hypothetical protein A2Z96_00585 [Spirochaetes bacterium GWB1_48_6]|nr:MAG: hypothetical protein A2Z96_00585 [Spirochaetes bacterium GWB1_48_6]